MSEQNEYSDYNVDELNRKLSKFKKLQMAMTIAAVLASLAIAIVSYIKDAPQGYKMIPIFLIVGIAYPYLAFGGIRKKIQAELEERS
ncbi:MAG: hypothetical protein HWE07_08610 [Cytophagia bacterium]|nr:hypothetical protein [Cytophagia bacterium]